jgi:GntR family galactonate operon transcriptional repressor
MRSGGNVTSDLPRGLHGQVVHLLGSRILSGEIPPGATLDLPALEGEFGISHTVLRESLKVLATKGLIAAKQKRGTFVTDPRSWNVLDNDVLKWRAASNDLELFGELSEVRLIIEPPAAALAAERADAGDLEDLAGILSQMVKAEEAKDTTSAADADVEFHIGLLRAAHNDLLGGLRIVIEHGLRQRDLLVHAHPTSRDPVPAHRAVLDAIEARDSKAAREAMLALLNQAASDFDELPKPRSRRRISNRRTLA